MDFGIDDSAHPLEPKETPASRADAAWRVFAIAAGHRGEMLPSPEELAALINRRANPSLMAADLFYHLDELASNAAGHEAGASPARLSELLRHLKPVALASGIAAGKGHAQIKRTLYRSLDVATPSAAVALARAAAQAYARPLSPVVEALLVKIAATIDVMPEPSRAPAQRGLRDLAKDMIDAWAGAAVTLGGSGFDAFFAEEVEVRERERHSRLAISPERVIATSFEVGALGAAVWNAVGKLVGTEDGVRQILEMVKRAPAHSNSVEVVAQQFATRNRLVMILKEEPIDWEAIDAIVARIPDAAAGPLIDVLVEAEDRNLRRQLLKRISMLGPSVCMLASDRLQTDDRWFVQRNMLRVIREAGCKLDASIIDRYVQHSDVRVREEAIQIHLNDPAERDRAISIAVRDPEHSMLKIGLRAAREGAPEGVMPFIAKRIQDPTFPSELRMASLHVLARSTSVLALEPLLRFVVGGTTLLGKAKLAAKSPEMLVAVDGLARIWPHERRAAALLALARASGDPEIIKAAEGHGILQPDEPPDDF